MLAGMFGARAAAAPPGASDRYWRIFISAADGGAFAGFTHIDMATSIGGTDLIAAQGSNGPPTYASSEINSSNAAWMATGTNLVEGWLGATNTNEWWAYDMGSAVAVVSVVITGSWNSPSSSPKDFLIQHSPDNATWVTASTVTGQTGWTGASDVRTFNF